ncbi:MAG: hypothetical protein EXR47_06315 [Dehalococcoidia bacterium]|nr:hypothetical protein [Dehalococcoidia bacterium]
MVDEENNRIQKFSATGQFLAKWGSEGPRGLAVDARGDVYVADQGNNRIQVFAPRPSPPR